MAYTSLLHVIPSHSLLYIYYMQCSKLSLLCTQPTQHKEEEMELQLHRWPLTLNDYTIILYH